MNMTKSLAPTPGLVWGPYPQRTDSEVLSDPMRRIVRFGRSCRARASAVIFPLHNLSDQRFAELVLSQARTLSKISESSLQKRINLQRRQLKSDGLTSDHVASTLSLLAEVSRRTLDEFPYSTQIIACRILLANKLAEMATGEGKTLATGLAAATGALAGIPVHVLTANNYLVTRDREKLCPLFDRLGLSSACVLPDQDKAQRRAIYQSDIVYTTANELVFDYLRDRVALTAENTATELELDWHLDGLSRPDTDARHSSNRGLIMRGLCMAIVDEADSILLDEACTPLVLSQVGHTGRSEQEFQVCFEIAKALWVNRDFTLQVNYRRAELTALGQSRISQSQLPENLYPRQATALVETALSANHCYQRDRDYLVRDGKIHIIDPVTGRIAHGRAWAGGLQQMIEIKEALAMTIKPNTVAQITFQKFFPRYMRLSGLSGSLREARSELSGVYALSVRRVPLRKSSQQVKLPTEIFFSASDKWRAVVSRTQQSVAAGQPVLIAVQSVAQSRLVSLMLGDSSVGHQVLNAADDAAEATIIARAGQSGSVTVATNMAGRGTDIAINKTAAKCGGLLVIACHVNNERRTDRQLAGRAGRRGQPGQVQRYLSLDDEIVASVKGPLSAICERTTGQKLAGTVRLITQQAFFLTQRVSEIRHRRLRLQLLETGLTRDKLLAHSGVGE